MEKKMIRTIIIAEAGVNHNGDLQLAKSLIDEAEAAGADYVKFQTFITELGITKSAKKANYQLGTTDNEESQFDMVKQLEFSFNDFTELFQYCSDKKIEFLSTPFDSPSIDFLQNLGLNIFKIPSGEITNLPYLRKIGGLGKEIIMSTGMATLKEVQDALIILERAGSPKEKVTVLHCNTDYPTPMSDVNLKAMLTIKKELGVRVGYSDHTQGIEVPIAAVAMGASVIEKHFTLDSGMPGPDHLASLEPTQLKGMVKAIRNIEKAIGSGVKEPSPSEKINVGIVRKSIVAARKIRMGETFTIENITVKRPGTGISPMKWDSVLGKPAPRDFSKDDFIL
jgi:N,N'-diacetyllegionaminate synthase